MALGPITPGINIDGLNVVSTLQSNANEPQPPDYELVSEDFSQTSTEDSMQLYIDGMRSDLNRMAAQGVNVLDYCPDTSHCDAVLYTLGGMCVTFGGEPYHITKPTLDKLINRTLAENSDSSSAHALRTKFYRSVALVPPYFATAYEMAPLP